MFGRNRLKDIAKANGNYTLIPNGLYKALSGRGLLSVDKLIVFYMLSHEEKFHPTQKAIAEALEIKQPYIQRRLKKLVKVGVLKIFYESHRRVTQYTLNLDSPEYTNGESLDNQGNTQYNQGNTQYNQGNTQYNQENVLDNPGNTNNMNKRNLQDDLQDDLQDRSKTGRSSLGSASLKNKKGSGAFTPDYDGYNPSEVTRLEKITPPPITTPSPDEIIAELLKDIKNRPENDKIQQRNRDVIEGKVKL